jgi:hypothetical protein
LSPCHLPCMLFLILTITNSMDQSIDVYADY